MVFFTVDAFTQFGLEGAPKTLPGGTRTTFRVGDVVLKHVHPTALENDHSQELAAWIASLFSSLDVHGARIPRPVPTCDGAWITPDGWTGWHFVDGQHAQAGHIPACIAAIQAFHRALAGIPRHPLMEGNSTPWGMADRLCWTQGMPANLQPELQPPLERLYALRKPLPAYRRQLIHGDLNPENMLISPGIPPAILDFSPFWGPPDFALAIFANFIGPRKGDMQALKHFRGIPHFSQLLVRAAIRMLLVMSFIDQLEDWQNCSEKKAAEMVIDHLTTSHPEGTYV